MKRLGILSSVILALMLALQLTTGVSAAKTGGEVIVFPGHAISQEVLGTPKVITLPGGYTRIQQVEQYVLISDNPEYAKYTSGINTVNVTLLFDPHGIPVSIKGTFHTTITGNDKTGWNGTFEGKLGANGVVVYATGHGYGDLAAYKDDIVQYPDNTFIVTVCPPNRS